MRILVNDFAGHPFPLQLSRALARSGHTVLHTYFEANNTPKGRLNGAGDGLVIKGITIGGKFRKHALLSRRNADIRFGRVIADCVTDFKPDVVISGNVPLDAQQIVLKATHDCGAKFVFWLQDVLSAGIEFALRKKHVPLAGVAGTLYRRLERRLLQNSDAVVCISVDFQMTIQHWNIEPRKTFVIENWAPLDEIRPLPRSNSWSTEYGLEGKFSFMYSGTLGMKHTPELLLELARRFESREDVVTVVVAEGVGAEWLQQNQGGLRPGALRLLPFQPYHRLPEVLASSDVLIALLDEDCGSFAIPSKALSYLCAGRPLLMAAPAGNLALEIVRRARAGEAVGTSVPEFLSAADRLLDDIEALKKYSVQSRCYAERNFDIDRIRDRFLGVFNFALGRGNEGIT
jgi:colanic acid biosynthesis glycosyl transferase WcaI